jgi:hypothetical protein
VPSTQAWPSSQQTSPHCWGAGQPPVLVPLSVPAVVVPLSVPAVSVPLVVLVPVIVIVPGEVAVVLALSLVRPSPPLHAGPRIRRRVVEVVKSARLRCEAMAHGSQSAQMSKLRRTHSVFA